MLTENTDGGGGLGTASSVCAISPQDEQAIINNLISRIEKLEFNLSQFMAGNVYANQLSDLAQQVGWLYNVTYMGIPGWTQTEYGTLIPPKGFTLSSIGFELLDACTGEYKQYQGVSYDSDGVLQFGFKSDGNVCGEKATQWDMGYAAGLPDFYIYQQGSLLINGNPYEASRGITVYSSSVGGSGSWSIGVIVSQAGIYQISASSEWTTGITIPSAGDGSAFATLTISTTNEVGGTQNYGISTVSNIGDIGYIPGVSAGNLFVGPGVTTVSNSQAFDLPAGGVIVVGAELDLTGGASNDGRGKINVSIVRLGTGVE